MSTCKICHKETLVGDLCLEHLAQKSKPAKPKRKTAKRKTAKRAAPKRRTAKRKPAKRKTAKRAPKRKTTKRAPKRKTAKRKTAKRRTAKRAPRMAPKRRTSTRKRVYLVYAGSGEMPAKVFKSPDPAHAMKYRLEARGISASVVPWYADEPINNVPRSQMAGRFQHWTGP